MGGKSMHTIKNSRSGKNRTFSIYHIVLATVLFLHYSVTAEEILKQTIEDYFSELQNTFTLIAGASSVKSTSLSRTERYFVTILKKNQTLYSLVKTNSKGVIISEVIRGQTPERDFRNVADQPWFRNVSRKREDHYGFVKEEKTGRYYLFWGKPVLKGSNRFVGAVAVKIDLWDCFHKLSADVTTPFLIRLGNKSLYSHKWEKEYNYREELLTVPGVRKISVRIRKTVPAQTTEDTTALGAVKDTTVSKTALNTKGEKKSSKGFSFKKLGLFQKIVLIAMIIAFLVLLFYLTKLITIIKDWRLRKKIEKEDNMFS